MITITSEKPDDVRVEAGAARHSAQLRVNGARQALGFALLKARFDGGTDADATAAQAELTEAEHEAAQWAAVEMVCNSYTAQCAEAAEAKSMTARRAYREAAIAEYETVLSAFESDRSLKNDEHALLAATKRVYGLAKKAARVEHFRRVLRSSTRYKKVASRF